MSLRAYAKRRGVTAMAVSLAVKKGTLSASVVRDEYGQPKIGDPDLADQEWAANTDHGRAPTFVKERGLAPVGGKAPEPAELSPPPSGRPDEVPTVKEVSLSEASRQEKLWRAKLAELKYREQAAELIPAKDVSDKVTSAFLQCRTRLLGIPSRARQALPHLSAADVVTLEDLIREALEALAHEAHL